MSSENYVRIIMAENLRFLGEGSSAQGKPGAKARPRGVVDAHIRWKFRSHHADEKLTHGDIRTRALVAPGERDRNKVGKSEMLCGEKRRRHGARTANRHR